jgi:hypothetical protein
MADPEYPMSCYTDNLINYLCGAESYCTGHKMYRYSIVFQHFVEPESSLLLSEELSNSTYPEKDPFSLHHPIPALQDPS